MKRAAIYIRTSTEQQSDKVSPQAQENDCLAYCQSKGYQVVDSFRDTEKYRSNGRVVEPSGTRNDRPQFKLMLDAMDAGMVDVLVAWREDRLYRGVNRAMLEISERVSSGIIDVELVKEHYDSNTAPVKAWAAGVEMQARHDRQLMGVAGGLARGHLWCSNPPYGYDYDKDKGSLIINDIEAEWVRKVWTWYGNNVSSKEIRRRLVTAGVPQKGTAPRKHAWSPSSVRAILHRDDYFTGNFCCKLGR